MSEANTPFAQIGEKISQTSKTIVREQHVGLNPAHRELDLRLTTEVANAETLANEATSVEQRVAAVSTESANLFPVRAEYRKLTRQIDEARRRLAFWEDNLRRIDLTMTAEKSQTGVELNFVKPCTEISRPVSPDLAQIILAAIVLGMLAGAVSVFSAYRTDESFTDAEQVPDAVGLPLFGSVSEIISRDQRRARRLRQTFVFPVGVAAMIAVLIAITTLLYMSLERPHPFNDAADLRPGSEPAPAATGENAVTNEQGHSDV